MRAAGKWFYFFPVFFLLMILAGTVFNEKLNEIGFNKVGAYLLVFSLLMNLIVSICFCRPQNMKRLFVSGAMIKYAMMIPYILCLLGAGLMGMMTFLSFIPVPFMISFLLGGPLGAAVFFLLSLIVSWFGTSYVISYCVASKKSGVMKTAECTIHILLQFFGITSFISIIILTVRRKRTWSS